jgi:hypothetical protein
MVSVRYITDDVEAAVAFYAARPPEGGAQLIWVVLQSPAGATI